MGKRVDRTGEEKLNNFGSKMIITRYKNNKDIDVYFPEYNWVASNRHYVDFQKGEIKCPYERRVYSVGYIGEGKYTTKSKKIYNLWLDMLYRCYDEEYHKKRPTYINCYVDNDLHNFQNFAKWFEDNYYEIEGEQMHLDKDILIKGNKVYSYDTCVFVPQKINDLFTNRFNNRGDYPIGVTPNKKTGKYVSQCSMGDSKSIYLGIYDTPEEAFTAYKNTKEKYIKEVAEEYKNKIPNKLYEAMMNYEVEITD